MTLHMAGAHGAAGESISEADLVKVARRISQWRRKRDTILAPIAFADPEWDILLDLYVENGCGRPVSLSSLCIAAAVPATTAARCVNAMVAQGVLTKTPDPDDARRVVIGLADETQAKMRAWLLLLAHSGAG